MPTDRASHPFDDNAADDSTPRQPSFRNAGTVGMVLFLASLFMLFTASLIGFVWVRYGDKSPPPGSIHLPGALWLSTVLVIGVSMALGRAAKQIHKGKQRSYRNALTAALALAAGFLTVQAPAMMELLADHHRVRQQTGGTHLYGLIFILILLHALHVVGGMVALVWVTVKAHRGDYERAAGGHDPIRHTTLYWHFLDIVWVIMFAVFYFMR